MNVLIQKVIPLIHVIRIHRTCVWKSPVIPSSTFQWDLTLYLLIWTVSHINRVVHQWTWSLTSFTWSAHRKGSYLMLLKEGQDILSSAAILNRTSSYCRLLVSRPLGRKQWFFWWRSRQPVISQRHSGNLDLLNSHYRHFVYEGKESERTLVRVNSRGVVIFPAGDDKNTGSWLKW